MNKSNNQSVDVPETFCNQNILALPQELFGVIKSFLMLPKDVYLERKDFYDHLQISSLHDIVNILYDNGFYNIGYQDKLLSVVEFSKNILIPLAYRRKTLIRIAFAVCDISQLYKMAFPFAKCILNNRFNWTYMCCPGDICIINGCPYTFQGIPTYIPRKGIVVDYRDKYILVKYYEFTITLVVNNHFDLEWQSTLEPTLYIITDRTWVFLEKRNGSLPVFTRGKMWV
jgi:hypothetical protein